MTTTPARPTKARIHAALTSAHRRVSLLCDADGTIEWASPSVARILGWVPETLVGTSLFDLYAPESRAYSERGFANVRRDPEASVEQLGSVVCTARVVCGDGSVLSVESHPTSLMVELGLGGILVEWLQVPERRLLVDAIDAVSLSRPADETLGTIVNLVEGLLVDVTAGVVAWSYPTGWTSFAAPDGVDVSDLLAVLPEPGTPEWLGDFVLLDDSTEVQVLVGDAQRGVGLVPLRTSTGEVLGAMVLIRQRADRLPIVVSSGETLFAIARHMAVLTLADNRDRSHLRAAAEVDHLTGLANRAGFERIVRELSEVGNVPVAVVFLDLDDFRPINDNHGHAVGDEVLRHVGHRVRSALREHDIACRIGGDEFVVICRGRWGAREARVLADRLRGDVAGPVLVGEVALMVGVSAGVAAGPALLLPSLLEQADADLYTNKRARRVTA